MSVTRSCGEQVKLLGERRLPIAGILRLLLAHHVDHLNPTKDDASTGNGLKAEHWPHSPLDGTVILLNAVVEVASLSDPDRGLSFRCERSRSRSVVSQDRMASR